MKVIGALGISHSKDVVYFCKLTDEDVITKRRSSCLCDVVKSDIRYAAINMSITLDTIAYQNDLDKLNTGTLVGVICKNGCCIAENEDIEYYLCSIRDSVMQLTAESC